jgi:NADH-quinone oxidoreductase subunit J
MNAVFYISSAVAIIATLMVVTRSNAVHALLYLIVSLLSVGMMFFVIGAPFAAALEVIIYAGAIMVLFVFVIMMLNVGGGTPDRNHELMQPSRWLGPAALVVVLAGELFYVLIGLEGNTTGLEVSPKEVSVALLGPYLLGVELASILLMAGLVGAFHLGYRDRPPAGERKE